MRDDSDAADVFDAACSLIMIHGPNTVPMINERIDNDKSLNDQLSIEAWQDVREAAVTLLASRPCLLGCHGWSPAERQGIVDLCHSMPLTALVKVKRQGTG